MNSFQWMVRRYTGAEVNLSADELKRVEQRCNEIMSAQQVRFWIVLAVMVTTTVLSAWIGARLLGPMIAMRLGLSERWCVAGAGILIAAAATAIWLFCLTRMYVSPLRRALCELGYETCIRCGYWLRDLPRDVAQCPECGAPRDGRHDE